MLLSLSPQISSTASLMHVMGEARTASGGRSVNTKQRWQDSALVQIFEGFHRANQQDKEGNSKEAFPHYVWRNTNLPRFRIISKGGKKTWNACEILQIFGTEGFGEMLFFALDLKMIQHEETATE